MKLRNTLTLIVVALLVGGLAATGCMALNDTLNDIESQSSSVFGTTPSSNFSQDGSIAFSVLPRRDENGDTSESDITVNVKNDDGTYTECEYSGKEEVEGSEFNSLALLMDNSGSMEREYPEEEYQDLCLTCPHDPSRLRVEAGQKLLSTLAGNIGENRVALVEFSVDASSGTASTYVVNFTSETDAVSKAMTSIGGSEMVGTPLYDSLLEIVPETQKDAEDFETALSLEGRTNSEGEEATVQRVVLVLSDGDDRDSSATLDQAIEAAQANNVIIHAIGLGPASASFDDVHLQTEDQTVAVQDLQKLADSTGGFYASVHDPAALEELFGIIAKSLTSGYELNEYVCKPNGELPDSGEKMTGTITVDGETTNWSMIAP